MKYVKIARLFSIAIILSLLIMAVPATPAQAAASITVVPDEGPIGSRVTIAGTGFNKSTSTTDKYAVVFFSSQEATTIDDIDSDVTIYEKVKDGVWLDENGEFEVTFTVPDILNDGATTKTVTGGTYYIYVNHYLSVTPPTLAPRITAVAEFTVTAGTMELDPAKGPVGTEVAITGAEFSGGKSIAISYDGAAVDIAGGDTKTDSSGEFVSTILIPDSTAGKHTITVTVSGSQVSADFTVEPELILNPTSGTANTTVTARGTGFDRREDVIVYFNNVGMATTTSDGNGSFTASFAVPELEAGIYDVEAEDESNNIDTVKFTVTVPPPPAPSPAPAPSPTPAPSPITASISATSGNVGMDIIVGGAGFEADSKVTIKYDGEEVATANADSSGIFVAAFKIPMSKHGDHIITISDGDNTEQFTFTMESEAPPVPAPLLPEMGVRVKSPIMFDWDDVEDDSPPVTYTLQIATSQNFASGSVVLEKEELTDSEYTITEVEKSRLAGKDTPYYWRVRAMDGASNEGEWTGAGEFYLSQPFAMPKWALYTIFGIGGLLLFAIGYWFGRRTAYYY